MNGITITDVERLLWLYLMRSEVYVRRDALNQRPHYEASVRCILVGAEMSGRGRGDTEAQSLWAAMADAMTLRHDDTQFDRAAA